MKVPIYSANGELSKNKIDLPNAFGDPVRVDMIRRAVKAARANRRQSYGPSKRAGLRHSVSWPGKGRGMARTPENLEEVVLVRKLQILWEEEEHIHQW